MTELRFQFEVFEGPLDLLLHLVRKEEVDIYEVDMVKIADQFCEYVELMKRFDLNKDGRLDRAERDAARPAAIEQKAEGQR